LSHYAYYDPAGRLNAVTNANGEISDFAYNPLGQLAALEDGNGHITTWTYDSRAGKVARQVSVLTFDTKPVQSRPFPTLPPPSISINSRPSLTFLPLRCFAIRHLLSSILARFCVLAGKCQSSLLTQGVGKCRKRHAKHLLDRAMMEES